MSLNLDREWLEKRFDKIDDRFDKVDDRFDKVDDRLDKMDDRLDKMDERLTETQVNVAKIEGELKGRDTEKGSKVNKAMVFIAACSLVVSIILGGFAVL